MKEHPLSPNLRAASDALSPAIPGEGVVVNNEILPGGY